MRKYNFILMAFVLLLGLAQCKKEPVTPNEDNNGGLRITLKVDDGPSTGSGTSSGIDNGEKLNVYPATGAVIFTQGDKIYVGNNGKYVGTLTFDNGLFQGTISGDLSTSDYLHFYFVGNKPTSPSTLAAGTTTYTVDISDQSAGLPAISYAPSTAKYSPSTTSYTAKLLNKSALVKFVPSLATTQAITISGLNNEVQIDFANHTLAPTGNTGGITLYSESDSEKWAVLLEQASLSGLTVSGSGFEATIDETTLPSAITNNMYYNAGVGISMTAIYQTYEANNSNWSTVLASFNSESTPNPMLIVKTDISGNCTITREDGTIDFSNHSLSGALFLQNNVLNQTVTVRNGSVERVDGKDGTGDLYNGTVIFDNMTVRGNVSTDAHHYIVQGGTYGVASSHVFEQPYANAPYPALTEIYDGKFMKLAIQYGSGTATTYRLYGGKYNNRPDDSWCAEGYSIRSNTDSDSGTYPYVVKALTEPYEITSSSSDPSVVSFNNAASTPTPTLHFNTDYGDGLKITRANGIVDFNEHSANELFIQNNVVGESITLQNGTIGPKPIDGSNQGFYYKGTVIMENMTVNGLIYTDGHAFIINSGTYNNKICCDTYSDCPGTTTIYGGYFTELGFNTTTHGTYILYGGKYQTRPDDSWCATGYSVKTNTDSDSGTYPWVVSAGIAPYYINSSNWQTVLSEFNAASTTNPTLIFTSDISWSYMNDVYPHAITRSDGIIDFDGHTVSNMFLQNNVAGESVTLRNGTIVGDGSNEIGIDSQNGWNAYYHGTIILENMTVNDGRVVFPDGHLLIIQSGTYWRILNATKGDCPGKVIINGGYFRENIGYSVGIGNGGSVLGTFELYGGKYAVRPDDSWCATGYSIKSNTDSDSGTYPWVVSALPEGALRGEFTINRFEDKVYFSKGNLKYSNGTWSFHEHQYDYCFASDGDVSSNYTSTGTFDLFSWGTSGYNHGAVAYQPWIITNVSESYYAYGESTNNLCDGNGQADWGYNAISNGGNTENSGWRTLTREEWSYIINYRTTSSGIYYAKATVNDKIGLILLPDDWSTSYFTLNSTNSGDANYSTNQITTEQWSTLEQHGAVFLPAAGQRTTTLVVDTDRNQGTYWSATAGVGSNSSRCLYFNSENVTVNGYFRAYGEFVRLVRDVQ